MHLRGADDKGHHHHTYSHRQTNDLPTTTTSIIPTFKDAKHFSHH